MQKLHTKQNFGFTLIEIMIAVGIFAIIMVLGTSALLKTNTAHKMSQNQNALMDNLNFMMEDMTRNLRLGQAYYCNQQSRFNMSLFSPNNPPALNMPTSDCARGFSLGFERTQGDPVMIEDQIVYAIAQWKTDSNAPTGPEGDYYKLFKSNDGGQTFSNLTPADVQINPNQSGFSVVGTAANDGQPVVLLTLSGIIPYKSGQTSFQLESTITQRANEL